MSNPTDAPVCRATQVKVSNAGSQPLPVWIEPWCDELSLPPRSWISFEPLTAGEANIQPADLELVEGVLQIWATCPGTAIVTIDGVEQDTGSRTIEFPPELFQMPVKSFVDLVFGSFPEARPGGIPLTPKRTIWHRFRSMFAAFIRK